MGVCLKLGTVIVGHISQTEFATSVEEILAEENVELYGSTPLVVASLEYFEKSVVEKGCGTLTRNIAEAPKNVIYKKECLLHEANSLCF
jgi:hypothetical protein